MSFVLLIVAVLLLTAVTFIIFFGELPGYEDTAVGKLRRFLVVQVWGSIVATVERWDVKYFHGRLIHALRTLGGVSGWLVPGFYAVLMGVCVRQFFKYTYPQIEKYSHDWAQLRLWTIIVPSVVMNFGTFGLATLTDPGDITNHHLEQATALWQFPYDEFIFFSGKNCRTCAQVKPARSKHCSSCDRCVLQFDHHCIWLNNDVGYYNYRWFFSFLVSIIWTLLYGGYLCWKSLNLYIHNEQLPPEVNTDSAFGKYWLSITRTTITNRVNGLLLILCCLILPVVCAFFGEHLWLAYLGVTTNETAKWDYIKDLVSRARLYRFDSAGGEKEYLVMAGRGSWNTPSQFIRLRDGSECTDLHQGDLVQIKGWEDLDNIYDHGFLQNLKQKLLPNTSCSHL